MGRTVRKVPPSWKHPQRRGAFIPMFEHFPYDAKEIKGGLAEGYLQDNPPFYGVPVMPQWPEEERTHYQMYEDTTEGTPISPIFATPEALARWLADEHVSFFANMEATYDHWLAIIRDKASGIPIFELKGRQFLEGEKQWPVP